MDIILYKNFAKKDNSTRRPSGSGETFSCVLKDNTSVTDPVVLLDLSDKTDFTKYTYAYIPMFSRYYFVVDMVADGLLWSVVLRCDVLATYRTEIGNSSLYVLRSAAEYDGNIVDTYYPVKVTKTNQRVTVNSILNAGGTSAYANVDNGCFILGIAGGKGSLTTNAIYGSVTYFAFNKTNLQTLVDILLNDNFLENAGFSTADMTIQLQKSIVDPLQFIKSCIWVPIPYDDIGGVAVGQLYVFGMEIVAQGFSCRQISNNPPQKVLTTSITIPAHPQASSRGAYLNVEPYTRMQLLFPPFGNFELDTSVMVQASSLAITVFLDLITGAATLRVGAEGDGQFMLNVKTQVGVPINLTQVTHDYLGGITGLIGGAASTGAALATGNFAGAIGGVMSAIGSVVNAYKPIVSSTGSNGGFSDLSGKPTLACQFYDITADDNANVGRPLCQIRQLSTLPGYQLIMDGDVTIAGTAGEQAMIKSYLEGGYYYE